MVYSVIVSTLEDVMQMLHSRKATSDDGDEKRHISVAYTETEKVLAYVEKYLVKEESES